jgi:poly-gamma-glutamate capsule biosynthesis protein CapA/YwtB (metallophosphatase superfamily)
VGGVVISGRQLGVGIAVLLAAGLLWWQPWSNAPVTVKGSGDVLTIAATGDTLILRLLPSSRADAGFRGVLDLLANASVAVTNLEENLLDPARIPAADSRGELRWPYGTQRSARDLRTLGFSMVSLGNNHAIDYGSDGLAQTVQILDRAGLFHAGAGDDLAIADAPVFAGSGARRVAMISVAISASPESRATALRGEILGRPGVNGLRYAPDVTADAATFATLKASPAAAASKPGDNQLNVEGKTIKKGSRTVVEMVADGGDTGRILGQIREARERAVYVVVMVHSHEPGNRSAAPAEFFRKFAHAAIDAGAGMVVGHGPHQLRGIEIYSGKVILYSLGNFLFDIKQVDPRSEDAFEAGLDLYRLALGAMADSEPLPRQSLESEAWWESVVAIGRFDRGVLSSVELRPIDLGVILPLAERGTPRLPSAERTGKILDRLTDLSREFGTHIRLENGIGIVDLPTPSR